MSSLADIRSNFVTAIAGVKNAAGVDEVYHAFLGKKGELTEFRKSVNFALLAPEERGRFGKDFNDLKVFMEETITIKRQETAATVSAPSPSVDMTLPGVGRSLGSMHPISLVQMELEEIFMSMGFVVETGYDVETEFYNFDALNTPFDHPAREMQDTFWLTNGMVLRTQTSANQVRALEKYGAPIKMIAPGRCYRYETIDANHENTFFQLEGLMVDRHISIANLIGVMKLLLSQMFHRDVETRLRPGFFPFVEPGFELDIKCLICGGAGCKSCKHEGWLELLPCGLVHPNVLRAGGIDPTKWNGFAFGLGLTRLAMMKYGIPDIRLFNSGDIRMLRQFTTVL